MPRRSQIENWDIDHLDGSAARWRASVAEFEELFAQHRQNVNAPGGTEWEGTAKDAALERVTADTAVVGRHGEIVRAAADLADTSIGDLRAAQRAALTAITEAEADGFRVSEDLSVTDTRRIDVATMAARYTAAGEHAENIRWHASQLLATDTLVGQRLTSKAAELNGIRFDGEGTIQAASFGGFKQSPFDDLLTKEQALAAWEKLQADIASYNNRCALHIVGPLPAPQYAACQRELAFLQGQEAALRARLADFGIHPGEAPSSTSAGGDLTATATQIGAEIATFPPGTRADSLAERMTGLHLNQADAARATDIAAARIWGETGGTSKMPDGSIIVLPANIRQTDVMKVFPDGSVTVLRGVDVTQYLPR
ncbi:hypothetical protein [Mycolicibacterium fortuitum]|uniref:hypothetical protein n=1 Tax=Mycolicibacterium fortuitum TaxID=1766 RepID=UPI0020C3B156|nr:hypothetical protein [Mycolicibacterium fortuitum]